MQNAANKLLSELLEFNKRIQEYLEDQTSPFKVSFTKRETAWFALGEPLETKRLCVQIKNKVINPKHLGGIINYCHPQNETKIEYWVSPEKFEITLWDELLDGKTYFIRTEKHLTKHRPVWIWVAYKQIDKYENGNVSTVCDWNDKWDTEFKTR